MNKRTINQFYKVDIKWFKQVFKQTDTFNHEITYVINRDNGGLKRETTQIVAFKWDKSKYKLIYGGRDIQVTNTPCNYGGVRYWFICGSCYERAGVLYFTGNCWECRKCGNLVYSSQQDTKTDFWTWYYKAIKVARKIDKEFWIDGFDFLFRHLYLFPSKPKYMKWSKYHQLKEKFNYYAEHGNAINGKQLDATVSKHEDRG